MSFTDNSQLPKDVREYPDEAQDIFRKVYNATEANGAADGAPSATAWAAVKNAGFRKKVQDGAEFTEYIDLVKSDEKRRLVFGFAYVSKRGGMQVTDHSGEEIDLDDLETAVYDHVLNYASTGEMHKGEAKGRLVESMILTKDKLDSWTKITGYNFPDGLDGSWWVGYYIEKPPAGQPDPFDKVLDGTYKMLSIQGVGQRIEIEEAS